MQGGKLCVRFPRQVLIGTRIVDFVAPARKLVVEVDGGYHAHIRRQRTDACRDKQLGRAGYRLIRVLAGLVLRSLPAAIAHIRAALTP